MWRYLLTILFVASACAVPQDPTSPISEPSQNTPISESNPPPVAKPNDTQTQPAAPLLLSYKEGNIIPNPGAEIADISGQPKDWMTDNWGSNTPKMTWESKDAFSGEKYLSVTVSNFVDGDAKWFFKAQNLKHDSWYEYSDYHRSDGRSRLIWSCTSPEGKRSFPAIWQSHKTKTWKKISARFYVSPAQNCQSTLMHVVDRNGYLHTDHHQLIEVDPQPLKRPLVSITFDDIYASAVDIGAKELDKRGWKGSFYVTGKFARYTDRPEYANEDKVKELIQTGHELGSHSSTHPFMSQLNTSDMIFQSQNNFNYLKTLGQAPEGLAYPFGDFSEDVETEVKRFYKYARTSLIGLNDRTADPYRLRILPITNSTTTLELFNWIDDAERSSTWLILLFHDLSDIEDENPYKTGVIQYRQVLDYLKTKEKIAVLPVNEALKELK